MRTIRNLGPASAGFSLIELLVVVGIISMLAVASIPSISALDRSGKIAQTTYSLASLLEQARIYAIARNTYVWVSFYSDTTNNCLIVAVVASRDGTNVAAANSNLGTVPNTSIELVSRVQVFDRVTFTEAGDPTLQSRFSPRLPPLDGSHSLGSNLSSMTVKVPGRATPVNFTRSIQFTPTGSLRNSAATIDMVEVGLQPKITANSRADENVAVLRLNGITGQTTVYRP